MKNIELIFKNLEEIKVQVNNKNVEILLDKKDRVTGATLRILAGKLKFLVSRYKYYNLNIYLVFGNVIFADKAVLLILEAIIYYILKNTNFDFSINLTVDNNTTYNDAFFHSVLYKSLKEQDRMKSNVLPKKYYLETYTQNIATEWNYYRRFISREKFENDKNGVSSIYMDLYYVLSNFTEDDEWSDGLAEVIAELVNNVQAHTDADCIVEVDITNVRDTQQNYKEYKKVTIVVMNFSENCLYDQVMKNLKCKYYILDDLLYSKVYDTELKHKEFFDNDYQEQTFYLLTTFQNHVSSRTDNSTQGGGTGLALLTDKIAETLSKTEDQYSYVLSGDDMVFLQSDFLKKDKNGFTSFNRENDFMEFPPSKEILSKAGINVPGTIFHLMLIKE